MEDKKLQVIHFQPICAIDIVLIVLEKFQFCRHTTHRHIKH